MSIRAKSVRLTKAEHKALLKWVASFQNKTQAAETIGIGRNTLHMISISGSGSGLSIHNIRKQLA